MTIIAAIADAHIGNHGPFAKGSVAGINSRCKHGLDVLDRVNRYLEDINNRLGLPPIVVSLGDLFDVSTPTPPVIAAVSRKLYNADWRVLLGNHEMASAVAGDNALSPLFSTSDVYDVPTVDRDSGIVTHIGNEDDEAVHALISMAIRKCTARGKYIGICGQGPSDLPGFAEFLVKEGIESMSLNPDSVVKTVEHVAQVEEALSH